MFKGTAAVFLRDQHILTAENEHIRNTIILLPHASQQEDVS